MKNTLDGRSNEIEEALNAIDWLLTWPTIDRRYELRAALHEIGQLLCEEKMHRQAQNNIYTEGISPQALMALSRRIATQEKDKSD